MGDAADDADARVDERICDEFIPTDRVSTGQSNYTMMTYG